MYCAPNVEKEVRLRNKRFIGLLLGMALVVSVPASGQIVYDGIILDRANRWDGYPTHVFNGGKHRIWWCSQGANARDVIYYAEKNTSLGSGGWTAPVQVLEKAQVPWAEKNVCDPAIARGNFLYNGTSYTYLLLFTSGAGGGANCHIGAAYSNNGKNWTVHPTPVLGPANPPSLLYGTGMSGLAYNPLAGQYLHAFLDTDFHVSPPYLRMNQTTNGINFSPSPSWPGHGAPSCR